MNSESLYRARVHKFSSKPPGHDAARQRENQRRHRARVKGRIAELEAALSSTQNKLDDALACIDTLTAEIQRLRRALASSPPATAAALSQQQPSISSCSSCTVPPDPDTSESAKPDITCASRPSSEFSQSLASIAELQAEALADPNLDDLDHDCPSLPPPGAGESTMPCRDAYSILKNRLTPEVDLAMATTWLRPGFRRAVAPGAGCRVQTHVVFSFVDHITSI